MFSFDLSDAEIEHRENQRGRNKQPTYAEKHWQYLNIHLLLFTLLIIIICSVYLSYIDDKSSTLLS